MTQYQTKAEIIDALKQLSEQVTVTAESLSIKQFITSIDEGWAAQGYLQHLILSVKPFARAIAMPLPRLESMFATTDKGSRTYEALVADYDAQIAAGMRAELGGNTTPTDFRMPDDVDDAQNYLIEVWNSANVDLVFTLDDWTETDLDTYLLPHPALGKITIREMCYFTIHHNGIHHADIESAKP